MEDKEFSTAAFFLVSGISFIFFSKTLLLLDGEDIPVFTWAGVFFLLVGGIMAANQIKKMRQKSNH